MLEKSDQVIAIVWGRTGDRGTWVKRTMWHKTSVVPVREEEAGMRVTEGTLSYLPPWGLAEAG